MPPMIVRNRVEEKVLHPLFKRAKTTSTVACLRGRRRVEATSAMASLRNVSNGLSETINFSDQMGVVFGILLDTDVCKLMNFAF